MTDFSGDQNMNAGYQYVPGEQPTALNKSLQCLLVHLLGSVHLTLLIVTQLQKYRSQLSARETTRAASLDASVPPRHREAFFLCVEKHFPKR